MDENHCHLMKKDVKTLSSFKFLNLMVEMYWVLISHLLFDLVLLEYTSDRSLEQSCPLI
jgi:hypothetical protein